MAWGNDLNVTDFLERLDRVKPNGDGWIARCPAHEDHNPSLSVGEGDDGRVLVHCHAGCRHEAVLAAIGLVESDLFERRNGAAQEIDATYDYVDERGGLLFQVVRKAPKTFLQRRPDGAGGWTWKLGPVRRVLYRLPLVTAAVKAGKTIYVCEGEKDVEALEAAGVIATCNPGGAGKWRDEYNETLRGANVVVIADRDDAGRNHAAGIMAALEGVARAVHVVEAAQGKDASDHLAAGLAVADLAPPEGDAESPIGESPSSARIKWRRLSTVDMRPVVFLDKPLLQADAFHLVTGRKGVGKGTVTASFASSVTRGQLGHKRGVIWIGSEDSAAVDIKPRVVAAGGDPDWVLIVDKGWIQLPRDIDEIERAFTILDNEVGLLIIDPVGNHIAGKNSNAETDIRDAIGRLNTVADEHECMVFGVRHLTEKECALGVLAGILGSSAWVQVPRAVLAIAKDSDDPAVSHVQCVAGNRLPPGTPGRMFRIEGVTLDGLSGEVTRAVWLGDSAQDVETLLAQPPKNPASRSAQARDLILDVLEAEGPIESDTFDARIAKEVGLAAGTIRQLRGELKNAGLVKPIPIKDDTGAVQHWTVARTQAPREGVQ